MTDATNDMGCSGEDVLRSALVATLRSDQKATDVIHTALGTARIRRVPEIPSALVPFVRAHVLPYLTSVAGPGVAWATLERVQRGVSSSSIMRRTALTSHPITTSNVVRVRALIMEPDRRERATVFQAMAASRMDPTVVEDLDALRTMLYGTREFDVLVTDGTAIEIERTMALLRNSESRIALVVRTAIPRSTVEDLALRHTIRHCIDMTKEVPHDVLLAQIRQLIARIARTRGT